MRFKNYISEKMEFTRGKDLDYMFGDEVMCFDANFTYKVKGSTHRIHSHALKHLRAFKKHEYDNIVNEIKFIVLNRFKDKLKIYKKGKGIVAFGVDAIKKLTNEHILNYLDYINDKVVLGEKLDKIERIIFSYLEKFADEYELIIRKILNDSIFVDDMESIEIQKYIDNGAIIKFTGKINKGNKDINIVVDFSNYILIFAELDMYKIRTMYKAENIKNNKQMINKILNGNSINSDNVNIAFQKTLEGR